MSEDLNQAVIIVLAGTVIILLLVVFIIGFFLVYQKRKEKFEKEKEIINIKFTEEIEKIQTEIKEETFQFVSQELHDNISQTLVVTNLILNTLQNSSPEALNAKKSLEHSINQVRFLSKSLSTGNITDSGFLKSMDFEVLRLKQINRWNIDVFCNIVELRLSPDKQLILFRIFQELINNLLKHSQAKNLVIELEEDEAFIYLKIIDDGNQFDFDQKIQETGFNKGLGLKSLRNRVGLLNGKINSELNKPQGMVITVTIPNN